MLLEEILLQTMVFIDYPSIHKLSFFVRNPSKPSLTATDTGKGEHPNVWVLVSR